MFTEQYRDTEQLPDSWGMCTKQMYSDAKRVTDYRLFVEQNLNQDSIWSVTEIDYITNKG